MSQEEDNNTTSYLLNSFGGLGFLALALAYFGFSIYDFLMRATSAKVALQLKVTELEEKLKKQQGLCKKHGAALKDNVKRADALAARVEELEGRLVVFKEEKAGAEAEAEGAKEKLKAALAENYKVEEELAAKASEASGLEEKVAACREELQKTREDARASWEGRKFPWP